MNSQGLDHSTRVSEEWFSLRESASDVAVLQDEDQVDAMSVGIVNRGRSVFGGGSGVGHCVGVQGQMSFALETHSSRLSGLPQRKAVFL